MAFGWKKKYEELLAEVNDPGVEMVATVDLYAGGRALRAGVDVLFANDPIVKNTAWAFKPLHPTENANDDEIEVDDGQ
jgi:hypothetical protein